MNKYGFVFAGTLDGINFRHSRKAESTSSMDSAAQFMLEELRAEMPFANFSEVVYMKDLTNDEFTFAWWGNCLYGGNATGHSDGFCTADSCY